MRPKRIGLSGTAIKSIALFLMVLDHIYYFFHYRIRPRKPTA